MLKEAGAGSVNLENAEIIVSGGRGVGGPKGFELIKELADLLGGEVGASRAAVDSDWIGHVHQVGQTGKNGRLPSCILPAAFPGPFSMWRE